jgi:hypothetical protein
MLLLLSSWIKVTKQAFVTYHDAVKKLSAFSSILFQQLQGNCLLMFVLQQKVMRSADTNFPIFQTFHHPLDHMVPHVNLCCHFPITCPSLMSSLIFPLFLLVEAVHGQPLQVVW